MRTIRYVVVFLILSLSVGSLFAVNAVANSLQNGSSLYSYDESNPPAVFFFPKEQARWDGSKITIREWYMLTDQQKAKFLSEYMGELRKNYDVIINVMRLDDYLKALNLFSYYANESKSDEPSVRIIDRLLKEQGNSIMDLSR